ncbi:MAG TPA: carboxymuconolactone decarboxylase family protein [Mycobacterium sp.]|nr:carboxymuconolactone decarboxylase family protein [Mycobacterium sp.]HUH69561.1 carboxymuconolactone decarboxylase family protein [Mycobacterium sp.]
MSRIPLTNIEQQPEPIRQFMARRGDLNVLRLLANAPNVFGGWAQMVDEMFDSPTFSRRMRELIILRVAHLQGSPYELGQHTGLARAAGLTEQQINAVVGTGDLDAAGFSRTERTALDVVTELCSTHRLRDESFAAAHGVFGDEAFTELLMIISCYYGLALVLNAVDLDLDTTARFQP